MRFLSHVVLSFGGVGSDDAILITRSMESVLVIRDMLRRCLSSSGFMVTYRTG